MLCSRLLGPLMRPPCLRQILSQRTIYTSCFGQKERSHNIGNPYFSPYFQDKLAPPRWKHLWLLMMKRKAEIEGEEPQCPRSDQINWNYDVELQAFATRLQIHAPFDALQIAFTEPASDHGTGQFTPDNERLVSAGKTFTLEFMELYFENVFPKLPKDCTQACIDYLTSVVSLSDTAQNLGYPDLVQSPIFPVEPASLARCFLASVAAIIAGPGGRIEAGKFIQDFVAPRLIDKDIVHDIWRPQNPMGILARELKLRKLPLPEARLLSQSGMSSVTPVYFVGLFCDKRFLVKSGGETVAKAETDAAKLALKRLYGVSIDEYLPRFDMLQDATFAGRVESLASDINLDYLREQTPNPANTNRNEVDEKTKKKGLSGRFF